MSFRHQRLLHDILLSLVNDDVLLGQILWIGLQVITVGCRFCVVRISTDDDLDMRVFIVESFACLLDGETFEAFVVHLDEFIAHMEPSIPEKTKHGRILKRAVRNLPSMKRRNRGKVSLVEKITTEDIYG